MLENPTQTAAVDSSPVPKRHTLPNQRNRSLDRRKSGDRFDLANNLYGNDGKKNQFATSRNTLAIYHGDTGSSNLLIVNSQSKLIPLEGFSRSEAAQLLRDRWRAAMNRYNDLSRDLSDRPVFYSSGASAWGQFRLPHQILPPSNSTGPPSGTQMDFLAELRHNMPNSCASFDS